MGPALPFIFLFPIFSFFFCSLALAAIEHRLDINVARVHDLLVLHGMDLETATKIVEYRNNNGEYSRIEELIPLIGANAFELIKFDIVARTPKDRFKDALSGRITTEASKQWREARGTELERFNGRLDINVRDIASVYVRSTGFEVVDNYAKRKSIYEGNVTLNFYKRVNVMEEGKLALNAPQPKVFKVINHLEEMEKAKTDIEKYLDDHFSASPLTGSTPDSKVLGYFGSTDDYIDQLTLMDSKNAILIGKPKPTTAYKLPRVGQPVKLELNNEPFLREPVKEPKQKIQKELRWRTVAGKIYLPQKMRPSQGSSGNGLQATRYFKDWTGTSFWFEDDPYDQSTFGFNFEFNNSRDSSTGMTAYRHHDGPTRNNFDCLAIYGNKKKNATTLNLEYDHLFNKAHGINGKLASRKNKLSYTSSFNLVKTYNQTVAELDPYSNAWYYRIADTFEPYFKLVYSWDKMGNVAFQASSLYMDYDTRSGGNFVRKIVRSSNGSVIFSFKPKNELEYSLQVNKAQQESGVDLSDRQSVNLYTRYTPSKQNTWTLSATGENRQDNSYTTGNRRGYLSLVRKWNDEITTTHRMDLQKWPTLQSNLISHHRLRYQFARSKSVEFRHETQYKKSSKAVRTTDKYAYLNLSSTF